MNGWRSRLAVGVLMLCLMQAHAYATAHLPNTPAGMLVFHGSAALVDLAMLGVTPCFLEGQLCDDTQNLLLLSIIGNAAGWALYLAYAPPAIYNTFMWGLSCSQLLRLLYVDSRHDSNHLGVPVVCGRGLGCAHLHSGKAAT